MNYKMMRSVQCSALQHQGSSSWREVLFRHSFVQCQTLQRMNFLLNSMTLSGQQFHCGSVSINYKNILQDCKSHIRIHFPQITSLAEWSQCKFKQTSGLQSLGCKHSSSLAEVSATSELYSRILELFPDGIQMAFAYGSGVYQQEGHANMEKNMLDFIFVVDDPKSWHKANMQRNFSHYSFLKYFGSHCIARIQEVGAGIYFNTLIPFENRMIKYGIISTERLIVDLLDWDTLYVSGRLHKPVKLLVAPGNRDLALALQVNLKNAIHAALLLLPEEFSEEVLYTTIASLSYNGDFRMIVGEDHNKVSNIVHPSLPHFRQLYESLIESEEHVYWHQQEGRLEQDPNHVTQFHHLQLLPKTVLLLLQEYQTRPGSHPDLEEVLKIYANSSHCGESVSKCIKRIVWRSSIFQSIKTALTAGTKKTMVYSFQKLKKMRKGVSK